MNVEKNVFRRREANNDDAGKQQNSPSQSKKV